MENGTQFSIELSADTDDFDEFTGSILLENLPETDGPKQIFRTDSSGEGPLQFVGQIAGSSTSVTDTASDDSLGDELTGERQQVTFAQSETISLSNIAEITPPDS